MYRVWYWLNDELYMVNCGKNAEYAWNIIVSYFPDYQPYLEYVMEGHYARWI